MKPALMRRSGRARKAAEPYPGAWAEARHFFAITLPLAVVLFIGLWVATP